MKGLKRTNPPGGSLVGLRVTPGNSGCIGRFLYSKITINKGDSR